MSRRMKEHLSTFSPAEYFAALGLDQGESVDIVREIRKGFPVGVVSKLKDRLDVPRSTLLHVAVVVKEDVAFSKLHFL